MTIKELVNLISQAKSTRNITTGNRLEAILVQAARDGGSVYYSEVGPTGAWNVFGDCYDYAEAHPDQEVVA